MSADNIHQGAEGAPVPQARRGQRRSSDASRTPSVDGWIATIGRDLVAVRENGDVERVTGEFGILVRAGGGEEYANVRAAYQDLKCEVAGLGEGEYIADRWQFDNEAYAEVVHRMPSDHDGEPVIVERYRTVMLNRPREQKSEEAAVKAAWTAVPMFPGRFHVTSINSDVVVVQSQSGERYASHDRRDYSFTVRYTSRDGNVEGESMVTDRRLLSKGQSEWSWMTALGVSLYVAQGKKGPLIRNALRSVVHREMERGTVRRIRSVNSTGLMMRDSDGGPVFVSPTGIIGPDGMVDDITVTLDASVLADGPQKSFGFSSDHEDAPMEPLVELASATVNGTALYLLGDLGVAPYGSTEDTARGSSLVVGGSTSGKTSLASVFIAAQSPRLSPSEEHAALLMRPTQGNRGGTTIKGITEQLAPFPGFMFLTDDVVKASTEGAMLSAAVEKYENLVMIGTPGAAFKQATVDRDNPEKSTKLAEAVKIKARTVATSEKMPVMQKVEGDSTINRVAVLTHSLDNRCSRETWLSLTSDAHGRAVNRAWTRYVSFVTANPGAWRGAYETAVEQVYGRIPGVNTRTAKVYGARIAGLSLIERCAGQDFGLVSRALDELPRMLTELTAMGQGSSEERAVVNLYDSILENVRRVVRASGHFTAQKESALEVGTIPDITGDPEEDAEKYGVTPEVLGWRSTDNGEDGSPRYTPNGKRIGVVKLMDKQSKAFPGQLCVMVVGDDYQEFVDRINSSARNVKPAEQRTGTRAEYTQALTEAGIAAEYRQPRTGQRGVVILLTPLLVDSLDRDSKEEE